jgi:hypothetical protein
VELLDRVFNDGELTLSYDSLVMFRSEEVHHLHWPLIVVTDSVFHHVVQLE